MMIPTTRVFKTFTLIALIMAMGVFFVSFSTQAQNYVPNPEFENYNSCPNFLDNIADLDDWQGLGYPDYFNACAALTPGAGIVSTPDNIFGYELPLSGNGYGGFVAYEPSGLRDYLTIDMGKQLTPGKAYCVSFNVSFADYTYQAVEELGLLFTDSALTISNGYALGYPITYGIDGIYNTNGIVNNKSGFVTISGTVTPLTSGLQYLTIGNFNPNATTNVQDETSPGVSGFLTLGYYFLEDVSVVELTDIEKTYTTPNSSFPFTNIAEVCSLDPVTFSVVANANSTFSWANFADPYFELSNADTLTVVPTQTETYILTTTDGICTRHDTFTVVVTNPPIIQVSYTANCEGYTTHIYDLSTNASPNAAYFWDANNDGSVEGFLKGGFEYVFPAAGIYDVALTINNFGNCAKTEVFQIEILPANHPLCDPCNNPDALDNLTPNGSAEMYWVCPPDVSSPGLDYLAYADPWYSPTGASPDFYHSCNDANVGVPNNIFGNQSAQQGLGYYGLYAYRNSDYREYLSVHLNEPLTSGADYCVSFYTSLADFSGKAIENLGVHLSQNPISTVSQAPLFLFPPQVTNTTGILDDKFNWTMVQGKYTANGNEQYITIGNFKANAQTNWEDLPGTSTFDADAYYYIDNVAVTPLPKLNITDTNDINLIDIVLCSNEVAHLRASSGYCSYVWLDAATSDTLASGTELNLYGLNSNTIKQYVLAGTFGQCSATDTVTVYYHQTPIPAVQIAQNCAGGVTIFYDNSTNLNPPVTYTWDFGDGTGLVTTSPVATHVYTDPNVYTFNVTIENASGCSISYSNTYEVEAECDPCNEQNNLTLNPSFEFYNISNTCPDTLGQIELTDFWDSPLGDPSAFNTCAGLSGNVGVPINLKGAQAARTGNGYAGISVYSDDGNGNMDATANQFITGQMVTPTQPGTTYCVKFYASLADNSSYAIDEMSMFFSNGLPPDFSPELIDYTPEIQNRNFFVLSNKNGWTEITGQFTAAQTFTHFTIGNFEVKSDSFNVVYVGGPLKGEAYYYIDDVSVVAMLATANVSNDTICKGQTVELQASTNTCNYFWWQRSTNGIDTLSISTDTLATVNPAQTTTYYFSGYNGKCNVTDSVQVYVHSPSIYTISNDLAICQGETVNLEVVTDAANSVIWSASPSFDIILSESETATVTPAATTTYYAAIDTSIGCRIIDSVKVTVNANPVVFNNHDTLFVCQGDSLQLLAIGGDIYKWTSGNVSDTNIPDPWAYPSGTMTYTVIVENSTTGCITTDSIVVVEHLQTIVPNETINICIGNTAILAPNYPDGSSNFEWSPNINISNINIANPQTNTTNDILYTVKYTDGKGCPASTSIFANAIPVPNVGADIAICNGGTTQLNVTGGLLGSTYSWSPTDGLDNPSIGSPMASPTQTTQYIVEVTYPFSPTGCKESDTITVFVNDLKFANAGSDQNICAGDTAQLQAVGGSAYLWSPSAGLSDTTISNPKAYPTNTTDYVVQVTNNVTGCISFDTVTVAISSPQAPQITSLPGTIYCAKPFSLSTICIGYNYAGCENINLTVTGQISSFIDVKTNQCFNYATTFAGSRVDTLTIKACTDKSGLCDEIKAIMVYCDIPPSWANDTLVLTTCQDLVLPFAVPEFTDDADDNQNFTFNLSGTTGLVVYDEPTTQFIYTPESGFTGVDFFDIFVCDSLYPANQCDILTVKVNITSNTGAPVISGIPPVITIKYQSDTSLCMSITEPDSEPTTTTIIKTGLGTLNLPAPGNCFNYTAPNNYFGNDTIVFKICDNCGSCTNQQYIFNVLPNYAPIANDLNIVTYVNTQIGFCLENIVEPEGEPYTKTLINLPDNGAMIPVNDSCYLLVPNNGFVGNDIAQLIVCDPHLHCDTVNINLTVLPNPNNPPTIADTTIITKENLAQYFCVTASDPDGDALLYTFEQPNLGTVVPLTPGCFVYIPNDFTTGTDIFDMITCDNKGACDTAIITVIINNNLCPQVNNVNITINKGEIVQTCIPVVEPEGEGVSLNLLLQPTNGDIEKANGTCVKYTPDAGFIGLDTVTVEICDDLGCCVLANVYITVLDTDVPPVGPDFIEIVTNENEPEGFCVPATDGNNDPLTYDILTYPANGSLVYVTDSCFTFVPDTNYFGNDNAQVIVCDNTGLCDTVDIFITVNFVNFPPTGNNATIETTQSTPVEFCLDFTDPDGDPVSIDPETPDNGTLTPTVGACFEYLPNAGFVGNESLDFVLCDPYGECITIVIKIVVKPTNLPPNPLTLTVTTPYDTDVKICLDITEPENEPVTLQNSVLPKNGSYTPTNDTCFIYNPNAGFSGKDTIIFTACDPNNNCSLVTIVINVEAQNNQAPIAYADPNPVITPENSPANFCILYTEPNGDAVTITVVDDPNNGSINPAGVNCYTYAPNKDFAGKDTLEIIVCDPFGLCDNVIVIINVLDINDPPQVPDINYTTPYETATEIICLDIFEPNGDPYTITPFDPADNGAYVFINDTCFIYTPNNGFSGTDKFAFNVCDEKGACNTVFVTIKVDPKPNTSPSGTEETAIVTMNIDKEICLTLFDAEDPNNLTLSILKQGSKGSAVVTGDSCLLYNPANNIYGNDVLDLVVCDPQNACDTFKLYIVIVNPDQAPIANTLPPITTNPDSTITICIGAEDPNKETLTYKFISINPGKGQANWALNDTCIVYKADAVYLGAVTILVEICDEPNPDKLCTTVEVVINIVPPAKNNPPTANDYLFEFTNQNTKKTICIAATDPDGDPLTYTLLNPPANGNGLFNATDTCVIYTPNGNFVGIDTFDVLICDDNNPPLCDTATVIINVTDGLIANDDAAIAEDGVPETINFDDNDKYANFKDLEVTITIEPKNGIVVVNGDGTFTYTPNPGFNGTDTFTYKICDPVLGCDEAIVVINVKNLLDAIADTYNICNDASLPVQVLMNDTYPNLTGLTFSIETQPIHGTLVGSGTDYTYTPTSGYTGQDAFNYKICYPDLGCSTASVTIHVFAKIGLPIAKQDATTTDENISVIIEVLDNDINTNNGELIISKIATPKNGSVSLNSDKTISYTPKPDFSGIDTFEYTICDIAELPCKGEGQELCATNKVIVTVNAATPEGIVIYELLTPNGDSKNDEFVIANLDCTKDNELIIYNRWGNIVFEAQNYGCDNSGWWTGTLKTSDKPLPDGTYFYIFRVLDNHYERQGTIEINRQVKLPVTCLRRLLVQLNKNPRISFRLNGHFLG